MVKSEYDVRNKSIVTDGIFINISLYLSQWDVPNKVHNPPNFYSYYVLNLATVSCLW
jgi:hypothetical protein